MDRRYTYVDIFNLLKIKYKNYLKPTIVAVIFSQTNDYIELEIHEQEYTEDGLEKKTITTTELSLPEDLEIPEELTREDLTPFSVKKSIEENIKVFVNDLTKYDLIMKTYLFTDEACDKISNKYCIFGIED